MGFNQRSNIAMLVTTIVVFSWYYYTALSAASAGETGPDQFGPRMWWTFAIYIVLIITAMVGTAYISRDEGEEMGEHDERDVQIDHHAETWSGYMAGVGLLGILYLVMQEPGTFVIAHAVLGVMVLQTLTSFAARLYFYSR